MSERAPCTRDCPRRSATCHATCADYLAYEKAKAAEYELRAGMKGYGSIKTAGKKRTMRCSAMERKRKGQKI